MLKALSIASRATLALVLMIGFYALAIGIAVSLLYIPYAMFVYADRISPQITFFCLGGAFAILWSMIPRRDRFEPPGPRLDESDHPRLFQSLNNLAQETHQQMPCDVYLVPQFNAWVSSRGGIMGFGSSRVMGLGLPLLQALTVDELRAVVAHEFGHFHGGDTRLGPWIYKTRSAVGRTLEVLAERNSLLQLPFILYGKAFLRMTLAVSRRQEYSADELAARIVGAELMIDGLRKFHAVGIAYDAYFSSEVLPAISRGFRPPIAEGFGRFISSERAQELAALVLQSELEVGKSDPYDTHPSMRERVAALEKFKANGNGKLKTHANNATVPNDVGAVSLLNDIDGMERKLIGMTVVEPDPRNLVSVSWSEMRDRVWLPGWRDFVESHSSAFEGLTAGRLPEVIRDLLSFGRLLLKNGGFYGSTEERDAYAISALGIWLGLALEDAGWKGDFSPGSDPAYSRDGITIEPFEIARRLVTGELSAEQWLELCDRAGIRDLSLARRTEHADRIHQVFVGQ